MMVAPWFKDPTYQGPLHLPTGSEYMASANQSFHQMDANNNSQLTMDEIHAHNVAREGQSYTAEERAKEEARVAQLGTMGQDDSFTFEEYWHGMQMMQRTQWEQGMLLLPMGFLSNQIVDLTSGTATELNGDMDLNMASAQEAQTLINDPQAKVALEKSIANVIGINAEYVSVTGITVKQRRRLSLDLRRLNTVKVTVAYTIILPPTYTGATITPSTVADIDETALKNEINTQLVEQGVTGVTVASIDPIVAPTQTTVEGIAPATGGTRHQAGAFASIIAVIVAAWMLSEDC